MESCWTCGRFLFKVETVETKGNPISYHIKKKLLFRQARYSESGPRHDLRLYTTTNIVLNKTPPKKKTWNNDKLFWRPTG